MTKDEILQLTADKIKARLFGEPEKAEWEPPLVEALEFILATKDADASSRFVYQSKLISRVATRKKVAEELRSRGFDVLEQSSTAFGTTLHGLVISFRQ